MAIIGVALARNAENAQRILIPFACSVSAAIGDLVYQNPSVNESVIVAADNTQIQQIIGVIYAKPQPTIASVLILGIAEGFSSFTVGGRVFLSATGTPTTTRPSAGFLHNLGVAISPSEFLIVPNNIRVKLT